MERLILLNMIKKRLEKKNDSQLLLLNIYKEINKAKWKIFMEV